MDRLARDTGRVSPSTGDEGTLSDHETSFNTAPESVVDPPLYPASSRTMPVPEYLDRHSDRSYSSSPDSITPSINSNVERGMDRLQRAERDKLQLDGADESGSPEPPPPSYDEAVAAPSYTSSGRQEDEDTPDGATGDDGDSEDGLSLAEVAVVRKMQADRDNYLSERRGSYSEAIEMETATEIPEPIPASVESRAPKSYEERYRPGPDAAGIDGANGTENRRMSFMELEEARGAPPPDDYECRCCGPLNGPVTGLCKMIRRQSTSRLVLLIALCIGVVGILLFVTLFPLSFVYIEYHEVALKQSKLTDVVDRDTVYYTGCYVLGPDTKLVRFTASAHSVLEEIDIFTLDTLAIKIRFSVQYFLRPEEVGELYSMFMHDYDSVIRKIMVSSIKNLAGESLTLDWFRFNRTLVENTMHSMIRMKLGGNCCPDCCPDGCQDNNYCTQCSDHTKCNRGYHIDVRYFHLLSVDIPHDVFELYLFKAIQYIDLERESFIQEHAVEVKKIEKDTQYIKNEALEIRQNGSNEAHKITEIALAEKDRVVQKSYVTALREMYNRLNVTSENHQVSLMLVRALEESAENLYTGYGFQKHTLYSP